MTVKLTFLESVDILSTIPQFHIVLETFFILCLVWFVSKKYYGNSKKVLSEEEVKKKLAEWIPEPLITNPLSNHPSLTPRSITSRAGKRIVVDGKDCLNLGTHNYLGLTENKEMEKMAIAAVRKYGVGSCGPRGFYGTVDVHLELEERLADFTETEEAVVYSYGFSTIASAIAAYCKRKDLLYVDEKLNFAIQKGLDATKANLKFFKHNDVNHLRELLKKQAEIDEKNPKKAAKLKRFLLVEGIYMNTGQICPLPELVDLCKQYKLRIFVDESISFGSLGKYGRGVTEHFGVPIHKIDMIMGSLEWAMGSIGGFCVGTSFVIEHHRLSGLGYCFSASLPPLLTSAAITSLSIMKNNPHIFETLKNNCISMQKGLEDIPFLECLSFLESPVKHVHLKDQMDHSMEQKLMLKISEKCIEKNLAVITPAYLEREDKSLPRPSLRLCVSALLNKDDINFALNVLRNSAEEILSAEMN